MAETLGSVPATRRKIAARLAPMLDLSDRASGLLATRDKIPPSLRWKLGVLAASGREVRRVLADHGRPLPDAYRLIATSFDELLRATGATQADRERHWPEELWAGPHLIPDALVLDGFLDAANALLMDATAGGVDSTIATGSSGNRFASRRRVLCQSEPTARHAHRTRLPPPPRRGARPGSVWCERLGVVPSMEVAQPARSALQ